MSCWAICKNVKLSAETTRNPYHSVKKIKHERTKVLNKNVTSDIDIYVSDPIRHGSGSGARD